MFMSLEVIPPINEIDCFTTGHAIHELARLKRVYGGKNWRKCKGFANLKLDNGIILLAEIHWYEG